MKIAIIGTGGVGGYFGAKLAQAGNEVTFLARGTHLKAIKEHGLTVNSIKGNFVVENVTATDSIATIAKVDLIILGVKAWQVKDFAPQLSAIMHNETLILPLQNGVLASEELKEFVDAKHVIGGLCRIMSKVEAPGVITHFGVEPTIVFGELFAEESDRMQKLQSTFSAADIKSFVSKDINADLWKKFISICTSGLMAITKTTYGELREGIETRQMMVDLLVEIYGLAVKIGIKLEMDYVEKAVAFVDTFPYNGTASLTRDVWEGRPSEIEYQNGTVVQLAKKHGIQVPINTFVYHCILPMEKKARRL